ncbi:MAG: hypothetical protein GY950_20140, partial [bacterium]|nr:hypothetical protein [bacterium]
MKRVLILFIALLLVLVCHPAWAVNLTADQADVILNGLSPDDRFGFSVASAGDFNGDGKDDVIVSSPFNNHFGGKIGTALIFFGGVKGTINNPDASPDVFLKGLGDKFGESVASAGDFNGDGIDDVIVSSHDNVFVDTELPYYTDKFGSVYIFFGAEKETLEQ